MQTFLPYPKFEKTFACLDYKRLGKQRVEAKQIYNTITGLSTGWRNHPAVQMWLGYEDCLAHYHNLCIVEWINRGYGNSMPFIPVSKGHAKPPWIGLEQLHASHRSNLLRKSILHYGQFNWKEPDNLPYYWPGR